MHTLPRPAENPLEALPDLDAPPQWTPRMLTRMLARVAAEHARRNRLAAA